MANVGRLVAVLSASTAPFDRAMRGAASVVGRFGGVAARVGKLVTGFGAAIAAVAGPAAIGLLVKRQFEAIDVLAKAADRLGATTQSLQALGLAAELSGVGVEELHKALEILVRRLSEANDGTGEGVEALAKLGLSIEDLRDLAVDEQFKVIADALQGVANQADRVRIATQLFGRGSAALVNVLQMGSASLEEIAKRAEAYGLAISRVDAAKVEAANDAWTELQALMAGIAQQIAVQVAPFVTALVRSITDAAVAGGGMGQVVTGALEAVAKAVAFVTNMVQGMRVAWIAVQAAAATAGSVVLHAVLMMASSIEKLLDSLGLVEAGWTDAIATMATVAEVLAEQLRRETLESFRELASDPWGEKVLETFRRIREEAQKAAEEAARIAEEGRDIPPAIEPAIEDTEQLKREVEELVETAEPAVAPRAEPRGTFGEADLRTIAFGKTFGSAGEKQATEESQKRLVKLLEEMKRLQENPPPVLIAWE